MNIKRIIREELDGLEWIKDTNSNQDIAQEIADKTKIKNGKLYPPFYSPPRPPSPTQFFLPSHIPFASLVFRNYGKEQYGLDKEDANDVWERYKDIIKDKINDHNNLNESSDLQWIKDTKSNQDISQEIADKTKIKDDRLYPPFFPNHYSTSPLFPLTILILSPHPLFRKYCKEQYGLDNLEDVNDVWKRYGELLKNKINNLNESNDFSWIDEMPKYDFYNGEYYIDISELDDDEACEVQQVIINMGIDWKDSVGLKKRFCDSNTTKGYIIQNGTLYRTPRKFDSYINQVFTDNKKHITYIDGRTDLLS